MKDIIFEALDEYRQYAGVCMDNEFAELDKLKNRISDLEFAAREMLSTFTEAGHPGEPCVRSCWVNYETHINWCRLVNPEPK